jgi:predicted O-methyltransferase YrrM
MRAEWRRGGSVVIENLGQPGYEFISRADPDVVANIAAAVKAGRAPRYAEIGIGIGATALEVCRLLERKGEVHLFDFEGKVGQIVRDLRGLGFDNVHAHGNKRLHWDSYVWSLMKFLEKNGPDYFDYIYIDGAHTIFHDLPAFILAKKLLRPGGIIDLDDYAWSWGNSPTMNPEKTPWVKDCMTDEQIATPQVKMLIDVFVAQDDDLEVVKPRKVFRKKMAAVARAA